MFQEEIIFSIANRALAKRWHRALCQSFEPTILHDRKPGFSRVMQRATGSEFEKSRLSATAMPAF